MKKIYKFILIVTAALSFGACNDFLTVRPKSSVPDYLMFTTEEGFVDALNGTYIILKQFIFSVSGPYYGGSSYESLGYLEYMGGVWLHSKSVQSLDAQLYGHNYQYTQVVSTTKNYFLSMYTPVTNLNLILNWIDDPSQNFLNEESYSKIKGEALALKAFLMFDLIRAFGPPPLETGYHNELYIPYPKELNVGYYKKETYTDYMELLTADILEAERLLGQYDPILRESPDQTRRRNKMNYYALQGLKARVMLWQGNKPEALKAALTVINAKNTDGKDKFPFKAPTSYDINTDLIGVSEHMFAIENDNPIQPYNMVGHPGCFKMYTVETIPVGPGAPQPRAVEYVNDTKHLKRLFPDAKYSSLTTTTAELKSQDLRFEKQFVRNATTLHYVKYYPLTQNGHTTALPVLRKAEMLLIAAECTTSLQDAEDYLNILGEARWLYPVSETNPGNPYTRRVLATEDDRDDLIKLEYAREFLMEGQSFFAWKRMNLDKLPFPSMEYYGDAVIYGGADVSMTVKEYRIPVPATEINSNTSNN